MKVIGKLEKLLKIHLQIQQLQVLNILKAIWIKFFQYGFAHFLIHLQKLSVKVAILLVKLSQKGSIQYLKKVLNIFYTLLMKFLVLQNKACLRITYKIYLQKDKKKIHMIVLSVKSSWLWLNLSKLQKNGKTKKNMHIF